MHISLPIGKDTILMASDLMPSAGQVLHPGSQTYLMLTTESRREADRLFNGLSKGGSIEMAMDDMFWGDYFGSFVDKFGIRWMISFNEEQSE
jgi:PhnB protein